MLVDRHLRIFDSAIHVLGQEKTNMIRVGWELGARVNGANPVAINMAQRRTVRPLACHATRRSPTHHSTSANTAPVTFDTLREL